MGISPFDDGVSEDEAQAEAEMSRLREKLLANRPAPDSEGAKYLREVSEGLADGSLDVAGRGKTLRIVRVRTKEKLPPE